MTRIRNFLSFFFIFLVTLFCLDRTILFLYRNHFIPYIAGQPSFEFYPENTNLFRHAQKIIEKPEWKSFKPLFYDDVLKNSSLLFNSSIAQQPEFDKDLIEQRQPYLLFKKDSEVKSQRTLHSVGDVYSVTYTIDSLQRRKTPSAFKKTRTNQKNLLVLGCSYTFGVGVQDNETLPFYLAERFPEYDVKNFGIYGAGPNDVLDDLLLSTDKNRFADINKTVGGVALYIAMYDHFERSSCTSKCFNNTYKGWVPQKSYYTTTARGFQKKGSFEDSRPFENSLYKASHFFFMSEYLHLNFSTHSSTALIENYVRRFKEIQKIVREKMNLDFKVVYYPNSYTEWPLLKSEMEKQQISYIDLSGVEMQKLTEMRHMIPYDSHPSALAHEITAELIAESIR